MEFAHTIPFVDLLGMRLQRMDPGLAELHLDLRDELMNSYGVAHGGVTMALLDVAMAHAARSPLAAGAEPQPGVVTVEMKTSFMRPGTGRLIATGRRLHMTATLAFCEGAVRDSAGVLLGHASGTFKYIRASPLGRRRAQRQNQADDGDNGNDSNNTEADPIR